MELEINDPVYWFNKLMLDFDPFMI